MNKKNIRIVIFLIEILVIIMTIIPFTKPLKIYTLLVEDMNSKGAIQVELDGKGWYIDNSIELEEKIFLSTKEVEMPKGSYEIIINYKTADNGTLISFDSKVQNYRVRSGRQDMCLEDSVSEKKYELYLNEDEEAFYIDFKFEGYGYAWINRVDIIQTRAMDRVQCIYSVGLILLIEIMWVLISKNKLVEIVRNNESCKALLAAFFICIPIFLSSLPCFFYYIIDGFDLNFHMLRIEGISEALKGGNIPARIQMNWLNGYGYPTSVFYGDFILYFPAILRMIGMPLQDAYKALIILVNILTGTFMYLATKNITNSRSMGVIASYLYLLIPYRLSCIYVRAGVGEFCAMAFFPLIIWGIIRIYTMDIYIKEWKYSWILPAFGLFGVISSHLISTVLIGNAIIFSFFVMLRKIEKNRFKMLIKVAIASMGMSAAYIIPLLDYMRDDYSINDTSKVTTIQTSGAFLSQIFTLFPSGNDYSVSISEHMKYDNEMVFSLGFVAWIAVFIVGVYYIFYLRNSTKSLLSKGSLKECGSVFVLLGMGILSMFMATDIFPWDNIANMIGKWRFLITSIQFSWRYLSISSVLLIFGIIVVINSDLIRQDLLNNFKIEKVHYFVGYVAIILLSLISAGYFISYTITDNNSVYIIANCDLDDMKLQGAEYVPSGVNIYSISANEAAEGYKVVLKDGERNKKGYSIFVMEARKENVISVPLMYYRGYKTRLLSEGKWIECHADDVGRVSFCVPEDYEGKVQVVFREPWYWRVAEFVSIIFVVGIIGYAYKWRKLCIR